MLYEYECSSCDLVIEITKSASDYRRDEKCNCCGKQMTAVVTGGGGILLKRTEFPEYNPAFGTVVRNSTHRKELAKQRGVVEIGNESIDRLGKDFEQEAKKRRAVGWDSL